MTYNGANVYQMSNVGSMELIGTALGTSLNYRPYEYSPTVLMIKSFDGAGKETDGIYCMIAMDKAEFLVDEPIEEGNNIIVNFSNPSEYCLYKSIMIIVRNSQGDLVNSFGVEKILKPGASDSIAFSAEIPENCRIEVQHY